MNVYVQLIGLYVYICVLSIHILYINKNFTNE